MVPHQYITCGGFLFVAREVKKCLKYLDLSIIVFSPSRIQPRKFSSSTQEGNQVELQKLFSCHL